MPNSNGRQSRRQKPAPDQLVLPFGKPEDLRIAWDSMDWRVAGFKSAARFRQVRELVLAIHCCGRNDGCRAYVATLVEVANRNSDQPVIRNSAHFYEVLKVARDLGFIISQDNWGEGKRAPSDREIVESRIIEVVTKTRQLQRSKKPDLRPTNDRPSPDLRPTNSLLDLNPLSPSSLQSSEAITSSSHRPPLSAEEEEAFSKLVLRLMELGVVFASEAVESGLANGCTVEQLRERAWWWSENKRHWPEDVRGKTLYLGIAKARPGLSRDKGWGSKNSRAPASRDERVIGPGQRFDPTASRRPVVGW